VVFPGFPSADEAVDRVGNCVETAGFGALPPGSNVKIDCGAREIFEEGI
jgi:hypothetical protein